MKLPVYLDYHSTTPVDPEVLQVMLPYFTGKFGNPSGKSHTFGLEASRAVEYARRQISEFIGADPQDVFFTGGTTESVNLVHSGITEAYSFKGNHIISSVTEHSAVLNSLAHLKEKGIQVTLLPVDKDGMINTHELADAIRNDTILVSIMAANNEIGTINDFRKIGEICRSKNVLFHTDAAQAAGKIPFNVIKDNIDLASFSAHKIYGPKGTGLLYKNSQVKIVPQLFGGGQEKGYRPGTLNVPAIAGFGKACEICAVKMKEESAGIKILRDKLYYGLKEEIDDIILNGSLENRLPNNLNLSFRYIKSETLIMELRDIAVSSGSACTSGSLKPSHVLKAIGIDDNLAKASVRFGLGRFNTEEEIIYSVKRISEAVKKLRAASPEYLLKNNKVKEA